MKYKLLILLCILPLLTFAHGNKHQDKPAPQPGKEIKMNHLDGHDDLEREQIPVQQTKKKSIGISSAESVSLGDFSFSEFPTLHPMIVHVPVILIPLAFVLFLVGFLRKNKDFKMIGLSLVVLGFIGGIVAAFPMHPHTKDLPASIFFTLKKHDLFAYSTLILTGVASLVSVYIVIKKNVPQLIEIIYIILLFSASITVAITGHYGGSLAYVHGVGSKGNYLESSH